MEYTTDSEAPDDFHFWSGVATIAGALRRRVWIDMRKFQWTPNFYIVLVGPPGIATKSTCVRIGMRLLEQVPGIHFGPPSMTWQALAQSLAAAVEHLKSITADGEEEFLPMSCLTIPISELGTFLKTKEEGLMEVLIDLWDGQLSRWGHKTITSGTTEINNPWINILGCTTPSWLKANFPTHMIEGGLVSRVVFVFGDKKRRLIAYPDEIFTTAEHQDFQARLVEDLIEISSMQGAFFVTPEARAWGHSWYAKHWNGGRPLSLASNRYSGYLSRKQAHIHKLGIVLSAARSNDLRIAAEHLVEAEALLASVEPHMLKVFESIGIVDEAKHVAEIVNFVRAYGFLSSNKAWSLVMNLMTQREFEEALKAAVRGNLLSIERREGQLGIAAPTQA